MIDDVLPSDGLAECRVVVQVSGDGAHAKGAEVGCFRRGAHQGGDLGALLPERLGEMAPDEASRPGDQRLHSGRS